MSDTKLGDLKLGTVTRGTKVRITSGSMPVGRIVDLRGPFGPNGMLVYRVRISKKPKPLFVEVCEDQLELLPGA
jgi:hypothetical protein